MQIGLQEYGNEIFTCRKRLWVAYNSQGQLKEIYVISQNMATKCSPPTADLGAVESRYLDPN